MALRYLGGTTTTNSVGGISIVTTYDANRNVTHETVTHPHAATGMTFVFEYGDTGTSSPVASVVTGASPRNLENFLYGKIIPLSVLGLARIGTAGLLFGPYFSGGAASFAVSFGFPANPSGERRVYEIALDGKVAWENAAGSPAGPLGAGFISSPFDCRFYSGTMTQAADPLETAMFGAEAVAYRPQMMLWFSNLPIADFDNKVPFVSVKIGDVTGGATPVDGVNLGEALERIAYSPFLEYDSTDFQATGVADIVQGMILTEDQSFIDLLRNTCKFYRTLDILQTDMLRVNDRGATVTPDAILHRDNISNDAGVEYFRQEDAAVPRELEIVTIDPDADYVFMPSKAQRPLAPVPVTASVGKVTITVPVIVDATTRMSMVTYAKYQEENARKRLSLQTMLYGYALEPGDLFRLTDIANGFDNSEVWKVVETSHGANYINEISAEAILKCAFEEEASDVILLLHANTGPPVIDSSTYANATSTNGDVQIDTVFKKFGAGSFLFGGTNGRVDVGAGTDPEYNFSPTNTSPYTIELWAWFPTLTLASQQILICQNSFAQKGWVLYNAGFGLSFLTSSNTGSFTGSTTMGSGLMTGTWHHIAVDKDSTGKVRIYVDGVMKSSNTPADSVIAHPLAYPITVGADAAATNEFVGSIDEVRITRGSRYGDLYGNGSFPPPGEFPDPGA